MVDISSSVLLCGEINSSQFELTKRYKTKLEQEEKIRTDQNLNHFKLKLVLDCLLALLSWVEHP
jgi:hypothetical protein